MNVRGLVMCELALVFACLKNLSINARGCHRVAPWLVCHNFLMYLIDTAPERVVNL